MQGLVAVTESADLHARLRVTANSQQLYEFQVKNTRFDHFIKVILRSYEGLFDDYVMIKESEIAKRAGIALEECISLLKQMSQLRIFNYIESKDTPEITFTEERLDLKDLHIDRENLADRKKRYLFRQKAMLNYASSSDKCRSVLLLNYFGEESRSRCGVCDICLQRNKIGVSDLEFESISEKIKHFLSKGNAPLEDVVSTIQDFREDQALKVIEWMIDNSRIKYARGNELEWIHDSVSS